MAAILWHTGESALVNAFLGGESNFGSPVVVPAVAGHWGLGLGTRNGGVGANKSDVMAQIIELGTSTAAGYARASITRDQTGTGWPVATIPGSNYQSTAPQQSFNFTGAPSPNGATLWFLAGSTTVNADNCLFGADLAATRTYGNGDVERVTATFAVG